MKLNTSINAIFITIIIGFSSSVAATEYTCPEPSALEVIWTGDACFYRSGTAPGWGTKIQESSRENCSVENLTFQSADIINNIVTCYYSRGIRVATGATTGPSYKGIIGPNTRWKQPSWAPGYYVCLSSHIDQCPFSSQ